MVRIAQVVAPDIPYHTTQRGTDGTVVEMSIVSPECEEDPDNYCWLSTTAWLTLSSRGPVAPTIRPR